MEPTIDRSQIRVLVVDDEMSIRTSLTAYLEDYDFDVYAVGSAEEALVLLEHIPFKVGVIDLRLPGMSGDSFILLAHRISPSMRFIIHTGSSTYFISEELLRIGIHPEHLFLKPVEDLYAVVEAVEDLAAGEVTLHG
jgi:DNA-binding NtrC family response regulator